VVEVAVEAVTLLVLVRSRLLVEVLAEATPSLSFWKVILLLLKL
jgi:hypothetical protein